MTAWSKALLDSPVFLGRFLNLIKLLPIFQKYFLLKYGWLFFSRRIKLDILPQIGTNLFLRKLFVNRTFSFQISAFRASLTDVATYGHIPVPLVYTQVRNVNHSSSFLINVNRNKHWIFRLWRSPSTFTLPSPWLESSGSSGEICRKLRSKSILIFRRKVDPLCAKNCKWTGDEVISLFFGGFLCSLVDFFVLWWISLFFSGFLCSLVDRFVLWWISFSLKNLRAYFLPWGWFH